MSQVFKVWISECPSFLVKHYGNPRLATSWVSADPQPSPATPRLTERTEQTPDLHWSQSELLYDWRRVSMSGIEHSCRTCDQILLPVGMLLSQICGLSSVRLPLWPEDGSAICSVITQWSESRRTRNHTLPPHLRLPKPGGPGSRIYIPQEQGGPVIPPGTGFPLRLLLRFAGLRWRYSNPPPSQVKSSCITTDGQ
jgi:hypothetical protein